MDPPGVKTCQNKKHAKATKATFNSFNCWKCFCWFMLHNLIDVECESITRSETPIRFQSFGGIVSTDASWPMAQGCRDKTWQNYTKLPMISKYQNIKISKYCELEYIRITVTPKWHQMTSNDIKWHKAVQLCNSLRPPATPGSTWFYRALPESEWWVP